MSRKIVSEPLFINLYCMIEELDGDSVFSKGSNEVLKIHSKNLKSGSDFLKL